MALHCPNCAASLRDEGFGSSATCPYCHTTFAMVRPEPPRPQPERRAALENEQRGLTHQIAEWNERLRRASATTLGDFLMPLFLGALVTAPALLAILYYAAQHVAEFQAGRDDTMIRMAMFACPILFVVAFVLTIIMRRRTRTRRVAETIHERDTAIGPLMLRLREVEGELRALP